MILTEPMLFFMTLTIQMSLSTNILASLQVKKSQSCNENSSKTLRGLCKGSIIERECCLMLHLWFCSYFQANNMVQCNFLDSGGPFDTGFRPSLVDDWNNLPTYNRFFTQLSPKILEESSLQLWYMMNSSTWFIRRQKNSGLWWNGEGYHSTPLVNVCLGSSR